MQLRHLARYLAASLLCTDYGPNRYEQPGERAGRLEDWGNPAYDAAVARLPARIEARGVKVSKLIVVGVSYSGFANAELVASQPRLASRRAHRDRQLPRPRRPLRRAAVEPRDAAGDRALRGRDAGPDAGGVRGTLAEPSPRPTRGGHPVGDAVHRRLEHGSVGGARVPRRDLLGGRERALASPARDRRRPPGRRLRDTSCRTRTHSGTTDAAWSGWPGSATARRRCPRARCCSGRASLRPRTATASSRRPRAARRRARPGTCGVAW